MPGSFYFPVFGFGTGPIAFPKQFLLRLQCSPRTGFLQPPELSLSQPTATLISDLLNDQLENTGSFWKMVFSVTENHPTAA